MKGEKCCGRIVVSGSWQYCPFCGDPLDKKQRKMTRLAVEKEVTALAGQTPVHIAGKTHFLAVDEQELQMSTLLARRCDHVATRGKPRGKFCGRDTGHKGKHVYR